jgi:hypothetical protein
MTSSNQDWLFHRLAPFYDYLIRRPQVNRLKALSLFVRLIISGLALIVIFSDAHATSDLSESQLLQLKSGAVLVDVKQADEPSKGMVEATILIDAPAESIWQIMVNCHEIPTFVPGLKDCRVLAVARTGKSYAMKSSGFGFYPDSLTCSGRFINTTGKSILSKLKGTCGK